MIQALLFKPMRYNTMMKLLQVLNVVFTIAAAIAMLVLVSIILLIGIGSGL